MPDSIAKIRQRYDTYAPCRAPEGFNPTWDDLRTLLDEVDRLREALQQWSEEGVGR